MERSTTMFVAAVVWIAMPSAAARAQSHWLFDPTPREEMRELSTDRPDTTESPMSVDSGHLQVETDLFSGYVGYDGAWDGETLMEVNAKVGVLDFADLQVVLTTLEGQVQPDGSRIVGMGDTTLRLKVNLFGNDGGDFAIGLLPMVTLPTGQAGLTVGEVEGGIAVPMGFALPEGFDLGAMVELDAVHGTGGNYHAEVLTTVTMSHAIVEPLAFFVEVTNTVVLDDVVDSQGTVNGGLVLGLDDAVQLDLGVNLRTWGNGDEDVRMFLGATVRH